MGTIFFLILFPIVVAILLLVLKADAARDIIVKIAALAIAAASILLAVQYFSKGSQMFDYSSEVVNHIMMGIEIILAVIIIVLSIRYKKFLAGLFAVIQAPLLVWFELTKGHDIEVANNLYIDRLLTTTREVVASSLMGRASLRPRRKRDSVTGVVGISDSFLAGMVEIWLPGRGAGRHIEDRKSVV